MSDGRSRKSGAKCKKLRENHEEKEKGTVKKTHLYKKSYISKLIPIQNITEEEQPI